jgi:hypothetical protein
VPRSAAPEKTTETPIARFREHKNTSARPLYFWLRLYTLWFFFFSKYVCFPLFFIVLLIRRSILLGAVIRPLPDIQPAAPVPVGLGCSVCGVTPYALAPMFRFCFGTHVWHEPTPKTALEVHQNIPLFSISRLFSATPIVWSRVSMSPFLSLRFIPFIVSVLARLPRPRSPAPYRIVFRRRTLRPHQLLIEADPTPQPNDPTVLVALAIRNRYSNPHVLPSDPLPTPDFTVRMAGNLTPEQRIFPDLAIASPARRSPDFHVTGVAGAGKTRLFLGASRHTPISVVVISRNLRAELQARAERDNFPNVTVYTPHAALARNRHGTMIIDEACALPAYLVYRLAALSTYCVTFGDPDQIVDTGSGLPRDLYLPNPDYHLSVSYSVPHDIASLIARLPYTPTQQIITRSLVYESLYILEHPDDAPVDALRICFVRECLDQGNTAQTVQGMRAHTCVIHICAREHAFISTSFLWTALTRATHRTLLSVTPHTLDYLGLRYPPLPVFRPNQPNRPL